MGIAQAALLLIVGWLPGAILFRIPILDRSRRALLDPEERAFWAIVLSIAISLSTVLALAAVGQYSLFRLLAVNLVMSGAAIAIWRGRLLMPDAARVTATAIVPILLIVLSMARFLPPAEYIIGGKDPGVYVSEGVQIAQRGSLVVEDPVIATLPPFARELFIPRHSDLEGGLRTDYYSSRFMGFFVDDPQRGTVVGQFPHLFPASIAVGYGIDGLTGARLTTVFWAALGVLAVYFAGRQIFGSAAAAAAASLLAIHVVQLWFARYPNAEIVMQALLFAAVLAYARAHVEGIHFFAPVAGGLLGLMLFLRLDSGLAIAAVSVAAALGAFAKQPPGRLFWISLGIPSVLAAAYMLGPMRAHWFRYGLFLSTLGPAAYVLLGIAAAGVTLVVTVGSRMAGPAARVRSATPTVLAAAFAAAALYALFLRHPAGKLAAHDAYALRTFANLYFTVPGVLAAILGFWLLARDRFWRNPALFLTVAVFATSVFYKARIVPEHFWMARRFLPVILPGALLLVCAVAFATASRQWPSRIRGAIGGTLILLLAASYLRASEPVRGHTEYEGLIPKLEALSERFAPEDLIIVESRNAGGDVHTLATPLAYVYARNVLLLPSARPDKDALGAFIEWARTRYRRVFFLGGSGTDLLSGTYSLRPVVTERFRVPEFEVTLDRLPRSATEKDFEFGVYEFGDPDDADASGPFDLDVGGSDDLHVLRFHAREQTEGRSFRWTTRQSFIAVTKVEAGAREVQLVLHDGGRPPGAPPAQVEVFLQDRRLGTIELVPGGFREYTLPIPPDLAEDASRSRNTVELRLVSTTWKPRDVLGVDDSRELGVMVDRVTIK